jgi:hypothetical protein
MEDGGAWKAFFDAWPAGIPRAGVLVTTFSEQIPFEAFMHSASFVMLERKTPDTLGARKLVIPFAGIACVKFVDVINAQSFIPWGFVGPAAAKKAPA